MEDKTTATAALRGGSNGYRVILSDGSRLFDREGGCLPGHTVLESLLGRRVKLERTSRRRRLERAAGHSLEACQHLGTADMSWGFCAEVELTEAQVETLRAADAVWRERVAVFDGVCYDAHVDRLCAMVAA